MAGTGIQTEGPVACPECGAAVAPARWNDHLLQVHQRYEFRGVRRPVPDTLAALLALVCNPRPDAEAWAALETLAVRECGANVDAFLASSLTQALNRLDGERRGAAAAALVPLLTQHSVCPGLLLPALASVNDPTARLLVTRLVGQAPELLDGASARAVQVLLQDPDLPEEARLAVAARLFGTSGDGRLSAAEVLDLLTAGLRTQRAIDLLEQLAHRVGRLPALGERLEQLEARVRLRCTRCAAEHRRPEMIQHLWTTHALVLDGRRIRDPWDVMRDWLSFYRRRRDPELLDRCRQLGQRLDPERGLARVHRLFLRKGVSDREARQDLLGEAKERQASLCPHCYGLVPLPEPWPAASVSLRGGRLTARGYRVELREDGLLPRLETEAPGRPSVRLTPPGPRLTRQGASLLLLGPLVLSALLLALVHPDLDLPTILPVAALLLPAGVLYLLIRRAWRARSAPEDRVIDLAWTALLPGLHAGGFSPADSMFLAGLALASAGRGSPAVRRKPLRDLLALTESAVASRTEAVHHLAALHGLAVADEAAAGGDPVALTVAQVSRCFAGKLPLTFADRLLAGWTEAWRTRLNLTRLRVMLLDRAFEAGFEVRDLLAAGQTAPVLGSVLGTDDPGELARLRLLWSLRPRQPWDRCGPADTVFALAEQPSAVAILAKYPDLLLHQEGLAPRRADVVLCGRGVVVEGTLFTDPLRVLEVERRGPGRYVLTLDGERFVFRSDPDELAEGVERWFRWYFNDFVMQVVEVYRWRSPHVAAVLRAWGSVACPECRRRLFARPGEVGISLEEEAPPTQGADEAPSRR